MRIQAVLPKTVLLIAWIIKSYSNLIAQDEVSFSMDRPIDSVPSDIWHFTLQSDSPQDLVLSIKIILSQDKKQIYRFISKPFYISQKQIMPEIYKSISIVESYLDPDNAYDPKRPFELNYYAIDIANSKTIGSFRIQMDSINFDPQTGSSKSESLYKTKLINGRCGIRSNNFNYQTNGMLINFSNQFYLDININPFDFPVRVSGTYNVQPSLLPETQVSAQFSYEDYLRILKEKGKARIKNLKEVGDLTTLYELKNEFIKQKLKTLGDSVTTIDKLEKVTAGFESKISQKEQEITKLKSISKFQVSTLTKETEHNKLRIKELKRQRDSLTDIYNAEFTKKKNEISGEDTASSDSTDNHTSSLKTKIAKRDQDISDLNEKVKNHASLIDEKLEARRSDLKALKKQRDSLLNNYQSKYRKYKVLHDEFKSYQNNAGALLSRDPVSLINTELFTKHERKLFKIAESVRSIKLGTYMPYDDALLFGGMPVTGGSVDLRIKKQYLIGAKIGTMSNNLGYQQGILSRNIWHFYAGIKRDNEYSLKLNYLHILDDISKTKVPQENLIISARLSYSLFNNNVNFESAVADALHTKDIKSGSTNDFFKIEKDPIFKYFHYKYFNSSSHKDWAMQNKLSLILFRKRLNLTTVYDHMGAGVEILTNPFLIKNINKFSQDASLKFFNYKLIARIGYVQYKTPEENNKFHSVKSSGFTFDINYNHPKFLNIAATYQPVNYQNRIISQDSLSVFSTNHLFNIRFSKNIKSGKNQYDMGLLMSHSIYRADSSAFNNSNITVYFNLTNKLFALENSLEYFKNKVSQFELIEDKFIQYNLRTNLPIYKYLSVSAGTEVLLSLSGNIYLKRINTGIEYKADTISALLQLNYMNPYFIRKYQVFTVNGLNNLTYTLNINKVI